MSKTLSPEEFKKFVLDDNNWNFDHDPKFNEELIKQLLRIRVKKLYKEKNYIYKQEYIESKIPNFINDMKYSGVSPLLN